MSEHPSTDDPDPAEVIPTDNSTGPLVDADGLEDVDDEAGTPS